MSAEVHEQHVSLKRFLNEYLYRHEQKLAMTRRVQAIVSDLFAAYMEDVQRMPLQFSQATTRKDESGRARVIADYIAGMTDRYAIAEHERIMA